MTLKLERLLQAKRKDLLDGFPARAVVAASRVSTDPLEKLNEILLPYDILTETLDIPLEVFNPYLLRKGIIAGRMENRRIVITVTDEFFSHDASTVIVKALTFQSVCLHQLIHRAQGQAECTIFYSPLKDYFNKASEIEAIAAGLAHDLRCKEHLSVTGNEMLQELSPRLANIMDNSRDFEDSSIAKLQEEIKRFC